MSFERQERALKEGDEHAPVHVESETRLLEDALALGDLGSDLRDEEGPACGRRGRHVSLLRFVSSISCYSERDGTWDVRTGTRHPWGSGRLSEETGRGSSEAQQQGKGEERKVEAHSLSKE